MVKLSLQVLPPAAVTPDASAPAPAPAAALQPGRVLLDSAASAGRKLQSSLSCMIKTLSWKARGKAEHMEQQEQQQDSQQEQDSQQQHAQLLPKVLEGKPALPANEPIRTRARARGKLTQAQAHSLVDSPSLEAATSTQQQMPVPLVRCELVTDGFQDVVGRVLGQLAAEQSELQGLLQGCRRDFEALLG